MMIDYSKRQQEIIKVTLDIIADQGIQNLTTKNISEHIEISEAALYRHFKSKLDIILSILGMFDENTKVIITKVDRSKLSFLEKLELFFILRCKEFKNNPKISSILFSEEMFKNDSALTDKITSIMRQNHKFVHKLVVNAQNNNEIKNDVPAEHLTIMLLGSLRLMITRWRLAGYSYDVVEEAQKIWNSFYMLVKKGDNK